MSDDVPKRGVGQPTKLTPALQMELMGYIGQGSTINDACDLVGIDKSTFHKWKVRGEQGDPKYVEFLASVRAAMAGWKAARLKEIQEAKNNAGNPDWRARAWLLQHRYPEEYGRREVIAHEGSIQHGHTLEAKVDELVKGLNLSRKELQEKAAPVVPEVSTEVAGEHWRDEEEP